MYKVMIARQTGKVPQYVSFFVEDYSLLDIDAMIEMLFLLWSKKG